MEITEIKIVEVGVNIEIRITLNNGLRFYSHYGFETVEKARNALNDYGLHEITKQAEGGGNPRQK